MVFSSISFLYYFLPITLILYFLIPNRFKNMVLLLVSLLFYFYGEPKYIILLIFSCIFNYYYGKYLEKNKNHKKLLLIINLVINFGFLFYFKYFNFFINNINSIFNTNIFVSKIIMPIGISFFTFQATSYVIDIYFGKVKSAKNVFVFATYLSLFPQLIAGPIVRYDDVEKSLEKRTHSFDNFGNGAKRFIIGLSKKVLIANVLGELSKDLVGLTSQTILSYWFKAISDALQIYFDFSGYSDMAIGLGLMFGFKFLENFNYPFISSSITEFWRRWHISLSSWFRDYVYIPLGGSRCSNIRRYINIFIVWMLTGLWHGASWNFILWGLYFAIILIIEKICLLNFLNKHKLFGHIYTMFLVIISFIIFNETSIDGIYNFVTNMFNFKNIPFSSIETMYYLKNYLVIFIAGIILSTPIIPNIIKKLKENKFIKKISIISTPIIYISLLLLATAFIVDESFNPFLYFRF